MTFFIVIHVLVCVFLVAIILIQPGKGDAGVGFGSSSQSIFGSRAGNFLTRTTSICALVFLTTSFLLTRDRMQAYNRSVIGSVPIEEAAQEPPAQPEAAQPDASAPAAPSKAEPAQGQNN